MPTPAEIAQFPQYYANPGNWSVYGPDANCTLELCPVSKSVFEYRPSLAANVVFIVLFAIVFFIQLAQLIKWRTITYGIVILIGCICEEIGYGGRIMMYKNPFSFNGFLIQIICITFAPVFFTAGIYLTLSKTIIYLGPQYARFPPAFYYYVFIPCDIISLVLQAVGGALSSTSSGGSKTAVDVSLAGLAFQVFTLVVFIALALEFAYRYYHAKDATLLRKDLPLKFRIFAAFLAFAIILILIRCAYRIDELSEGYSGHLIHNEPLFIALEGAMIIAAAFALCVAHPGPVFGWPKNSARVATNTAVESKPAV